MASVQKMPFYLTLSPQILLTTLLLALCVSDLSAAAVLKTADNATTLTISTNGSLVPDNSEERLEITYEANILKEIEPDVLQLIGSPKQLLLTCTSTKTEKFVKWVYHGIEERAVNLHYRQNIVWLENFSISGPPVVRMECKDKENHSLSNNTLIYQGDGKPPYLYNHGNKKLVSANILNETSVRLPCLLNYPLENVENVELQLFKDGTQIDNKNNCLHYTPEYGYILNLTKLEQPYGMYECRVINSTSDDFVQMELQSDDLLRAEVNVKHRSDMTDFFKNAITKRIFDCKVPKSKFENRFEWFFVWSNGSYTALQSPQKYIPADAPEPLKYSESVYLEFPSTSITHVACLAYLKDNVTSYNSTYRVHVKDAIYPKIVSPIPQEPIIYTAGMNLSCASIGDPITFSWLKDEKPVEGLNTDTYYGRDYSQSTIILEPSFDDVDSNYTCIADNFLGKVNVSYRVQLPKETGGSGDDEPSRKGILITVAICLAAVAVLLLILFAFFQIKLVPRRFPKEKIRNFFNGVGSNEVPYNGFGEQGQEPFESVSYDTSKEIPIQSLNFVRKLKGGNFGKVQFGYYLNMNKGYNTPVAIKSIKDKPEASKEDVEFAFENFLKEIKIMQVLGEHPNVVRYIGAVTSDLSRYSAYLVVEYCCEGDLATYLRNLKKLGGSFCDDIQGLHNDLILSDSGSGESTGSMSQVVLKTTHLNKWAEDIACGLEYISSKNLVHRDIAARNVLLAYDGPSYDDCRHPDPGLLTAKISDFGLSRDLEMFPSDYYPVFPISEKYQNRPLLLPLRWISLEALESLKFTIQSDVWAFGVTLWEMYTLGKTPYRDFMDSGDLRPKLIQFLRQNSHLPQPELAPVDIWEAMRRCWSELNERPNFTELKHMLHAINENIVNEMNQDDPEEVLSNQAGNCAYSSVGFIENMAYNTEGDYDDNEDEYDERNSQSTEEL